MTPAEIEAIKKTIEIAAKNPTWCEAIVSVMKTPNLPTITQAASSVNMSVSAFISQFNVACWKAEEILRPILEEANLYTKTEIKNLVDQARILYRSGIPHVMRAGAAGAGGAGAAATGAAAGKGAIILKGLAIVGGLIAFAVVSYYVAGYLGELWADDPIEPTWLGDPEARAAYQAEQGKKQHSVPIYSAHFIATIDGVDVTNTLWSSELSHIDPPYYVGEMYYNYLYGNNEVYTQKTYGEMCRIIDDKTIRDSWGNYASFVCTVASWDKTLPGYHDNYPEYKPGNWRHDELECKREILYMKKVDSYYSPFDPILIEERVE